MEKPYDQKQEREARRVLRNRTQTFVAPGTLSKPEALCLLKQNGVKTAKITELLVKSGYTNEEINNLWHQAINI